MYQIGSLLEKKGYLSDPLRTYGNGKVWNVRKVSLLHVQISFGQIVEKPAVELMDAREEPYHIQEKRSLSLSPFEYSLTQNRWFVALIAVCFFIDWPILI